MVQVVNSTKYAVDDFTFKYFEPGHTLMTADHFHLDIEAGMKKAKNLYDFDDFNRIIEDNVKTIVMDITDFKAYESKLSKGKTTN